MGIPSASTRALAQRLLALEATNEGVADPRAHEAVRVCEKLRVALTRFAGADGFTALLRRALALARADVPALQSETFKSDGCLEELAALADAETGLEAAASITAHLLGLLVTFIGESLTLRLVREAWPDASFDDSQ